MIQQNRLRNFLFVLLTLALALNPIATVVIHAKTTADSVIRVPQDVASLQEAIDVANDGDVIQITGGTYNAPNGGFLIGDSNKNLTISSAPGEQAPELESRRSARIGIWVPRFESFILISTSIQCSKRSSERAVASLRTFPVS